MPKVVHFEIPVDNPERAVEFYRQVFGWTIEGWEGPMDYWLCHTGPDDEMGIDGALFRREGRTPQPSSAVTVVVGVESADDAASRVEKAGGTIVNPKAPIPGVGWVFGFLDTEGNHLSAIEPDMSLGE